MVVSIFLAFALIVYVVKPFGSRTELPAEATSAAEHSGKDPAIPVDGIRYVSYVDAQAQTQFGRDSVAGSLRQSLGVPGDDLARDGEF